MLNEAHEWELVSISFNSTSHLGVARTSKKVCFPRRWGHQKAGVWYPRDKKRLRSWRSWGIANVFCKMLLLMEIIRQTTCYLWKIFTISTGDRRIWVRKHVFFERLIRQSWLGHTFFGRSSLRTSVARPKSCGALPAMNGTATSGKDLKDLGEMGPGQLIFVVVFFKPKKWLKFFVERRCCSS